MQREIVQQLVSPKGAVNAFGAVPPALKLFDKPARQRNGRIGQRGRQGLGSQRLQAGVGGLDLRLGRHLLLVLNLRGTQISGHWIGKWGDS